MRIFREIHNLPDFKNAVITIGSFDGVHYGHQKIIDRINQLAQQVDGESVLITFDPHPRKVVYPKDHNVILLSTLEEKIQLCEKYGIDNLVIVPFTIDFSQQMPREYIDNFLVKSFKPAFIVIGYDHKFGLNRKGDINLLKEYESTHNFKVVEIQRQELEENIVSSTRIRKAISAGFIETARDYLQHDYPLTGTVVHGDKIGKTIGYPTANIVLDDPDKLLPADGVYAVKCTIDGLDKNGMMYIGQRPTIDKHLERKIEVHLLDFDQNIYTKKIYINVMSHIRDDMKFENLEALKTQLDSDKESVLSYFENLIPHPDRVDKVCIAILNYNGEEYLEAYLPSVLYSSSELINITLIDNASSDESVRYIQEWHPEVEIVQLPKNYGFADGYNRGMEYVNTKYTVILNSDVKVADFWLDPIIKILEEDPSVGIVQPKILSIEDPEKFEYAGACGGYLDSFGYPYCRGRIFDTVEGDNGQYNTIKNIDWASGAAMVIRTELFKNLGGFDGFYFAHMEEIDLCNRVRRAGYKIIVEPNARVYHLGGGTLNYGNPRKTFLNFRNSLLTLYKNEKGITVFIKIFLRLLLDGVAGIKFLTSGNFQSLLAILKAHFSFYSNLPRYFKNKRKEKMLVDKYSIGKPIPNSTYSKSIVFDHFVKGKKTFKSLISK